VVWYQPFKGENLHDEIKNLKDTLFKLWGKSMSQVKKIIQSGLFSILISVSIAGGNVGAIEPDNAGFLQWKEQFKQLALSQGIPEDTLEMSFDGLTVNKTVLKLDSSQPEFTRPIWQYIDKAVSTTRIKKAQKALVQHKRLFDSLYKKYGVPAEIIIAIWAMESDFGANYGNMSVIRSLATLAYAGKRKEFAQTELLAALRIMVCEGLQPEDMVGSWAGAMGQPQFMPTSFQKYAIDFNNDNKRDLWKSLDDAFASIANYMQKSGWKTGESWGMEVRLSDRFDWQKLARYNPENRALSLIEWKALGVVTVRDNHFYPRDQRAKLFFPAGHLGPAFLTFDNFEVIKKYNLSLSYSLGVGLLSSGIKDGTQLVGKWPRGDKSLSYHDKVLLQTILKKIGFDVGEIDGKIGSNTRKAIREWQLKNSLAADGYMTLPLIKHLQETVN